MNAMIKKIIRMLVILFVVLAILFCAGRYGWELWGFDACESAGIANVTVDGRQVTITGFYPGSFPEGFLGCHTREQDGTLYVGFKFSGLFGIFETGGFTVTIPTRGEIREVIMKTRMGETRLWSEKEGSLPQSEQLGVYVMLESNDMYSIGMSYEGHSGGMTAADGSALESGEYLFMDNDIVYAVKEAGKPLPFTLTVRNADGSLFASGAFAFEENTDKMYLCVTSDGRIIVQ